MKQYLELCKDILENGVKKEDRTGTGTISIFGTRMEFDLNEGFPLLTTKELSFENIVNELLWFISGDTNIRTLVLKNCNIWNKDAYRGYCDSLREIAGDDITPVPYKEFVALIKSDETFAKNHGDLGKTYGFQWRKKGKEKGIDPLKDVIHTIKNNPESRRMLVVSWDASVANDLVLPPCHPLFQFYVSEGRLSCQFYMRSNDFFLGNPYNIASYALLTMMIAKECDLELGKLIYVGGDTHLYLDHIEQVKLQMTREPRTLPRVQLNSTVKSTFDYTLEDFILVDYNPHPSIKGRMST